MKKHIYICYTTSEERKVQSNVQVKTQNLKKEGILRCTDELSFIRRKIEYRFEPGRNKKRKAKNKNHDGVTFYIYECKMRYKI